MKRAASSTTARRSIRLFAQRRNLLRPSLPTACCATSCASTARRRRCSTSATDIALGDYLAAHRYSCRIHRRLPGADGRGDLVDRSRAHARVPRALFRALLRTTTECCRWMTRPQWRAIRGGSARYVEKLVAPFRDRIRLDTAGRAACGACATACSSRRAAPEPQRFDHVFFACHADQALAPARRRDARRARDPRRDSVPAKRGRAAHGHVAAAARGGSPGPRGTTTYGARARHRVALTYNMNILQRLAARAARSA